MRGSLSALIAIGLIPAIDAAPVAAKELPFCIKGCDFGSGRGDCSFSSYQQCQITASGRDAYCDANPYFKAEPGPDRARQSRRKF
jgi:hypothetical protein